MSEIRRNNQSGVTNIELLSVSSGTNQALSNFFSVVPNFPTLGDGEFIKIIVDSGAPTFEILYLIAYTAGSMGGTFTRGAEDATNWPACNHPAGISWVHAPTVSDFDDDDSASLLATNNLSDVASAATARANLDIPTFSVAAYGGSTAASAATNTTAYNAALAAAIAAGAGTIEFGSGTYQINATNICTVAGVSLKGQGKDVTFLAMNGTGNCLDFHPATWYANNPGVPIAGNVSDLTIDGTAATGAASGLRYGDLPFSSITDVAIKNFAAKALAVQLVTVTSGTGTFTLGTVNGVTSAIAYNASAATLQTALNASLPLPGATVTGTGPWTITWNVPGPQPTLAFTSASGPTTGTVTVSTVGYAQAGFWFDNVVGHTERLTLSGVIANNNQQNYLFDANAGQFNFSTVYAGGTTYTSPNQIVGLNSGGKQYFYSPVVGALPFSAVSPTVSGGVGQTTANWTALASGVGFVTQASYAYGFFDMGVGAQAGQDGVTVNAGVLFDGASHFGLKGNFTAAATNYGAIIRLCGQSVSSSGAVVVSHIAYSNFGIKVECDGSSGLGHYTIHGSTANLHGFYGIGYIFFNNFGPTAFQTSNSAGNFRLFSGGVFGDSTLTNYAMPSGQKTVSAAYTATANDQFLVCTAASAAYTVTLESYPVGIAGKHIYNNAASVYPVTVAPNTSTVDGGNPILLPGQGIYLLWTGKWNRVAQGGASPARLTTAQATANTNALYSVGAMYFDTTLNKLRIGGATGWETVTSV